MQLFLKGNTFAYELENVLRAFVPDVTVHKDCAPPKHAMNYAYLRVTETGQGVKLSCVVDVCRARFCKVQPLPGDSAKAVVEQALAAMLYDIMGTALHRWPAWGIVTGVRPAKVALHLLQEKNDEAQTAWRLMTDHRVAADKARLAMETAKNGQQLAGTNTLQSCSLYIAIPFCPSRCSYCSFVSKTVDRDHALVDGYVQALCKELAVRGRTVKESGLRLESIYIGGGTPTVLTDTHLRSLTDAVAMHFAVSDVREYTVEAGRPDTITQEKLAVLKAAGVTRISINPQTANDAVLRGIGRRHTAQDIADAVALAKTVGFPVINMDLIAGLPGDSLISFRHTLEWLLAFDPENITLHALTVKRASFLRDYGGMPAREAAAMVEIATETLHAHGYRPYYMYKQKGTVDGLENTGYAKPGTECLYNVYMMDELHTVLACGAGAVTKWVDQKTGRITRTFNYKYPAEYIDGFDTLRARW